MDPTGRHKLPRGSELGHGAALGKKLQAGKLLLALPSPHPCSHPMPLSQLFKRLPNCPQGGKKAGELIPVGVALSGDKGCHQGTSAGTWQEVPSVPPLYLQGQACVTSPSCHPSLTVLGMWTSGFM